MACLESRQEMPAIDADVKEALSEGVDLLTSFGPSRVLAQGGAVTGMELVRCTSVFDPEGRFAPTFDATKTVTVKADQVILAIGQAPDLTVASGVSVLLGERGLVATIGDSCVTPIEGVFAAGDATSGPATVVKAIASARRAADSIDVYLGGRGRLSSAPAWQGLARCSSACHLPSERVAVAPVELPVRDLDHEDIRPFSADEAAGEALRCMNCGCVAVSPSDMAPALMVLDALVRTTRRDIRIEDFFSATLGGSTVLDGDEIVREIVIPPSSDGLHSAFLKFRIRQSIDFPLLCAAVAYRIEDGVMRDVRVALGAAAPLPLRLAAVEQQLEGKELTAEAAEAAALAVRVGASALAKNDYKLQIAKALVRRAILAAV
jgi:CO/xanthine dehydrogenase FAD-binding subunit